MTQINTKPIALITGASSGIGAAFAQQLASKGFDLILTGRRQDKLEALQQALTHQFNCQVEIIIAELTNPDDLARIEMRIKSCDNLTLLINNAGFGTRDLFIKTPIEKHLAMLQVHDAAPLRFIHAALPGMIKRKQGSIINVSSLLSYMSQIYTVNYSASKAYLIALSRVLNKELKNTNIHVQCLCPGLTYSDFFQRDELKETKIYQQIPRWLWMIPEQVVIASLAALATKKCVVVPGAMNRFFHTLLDITRAFSHCRIYRRNRKWCN